MLKAIFIILGIAALFCFIVAVGGAVFAVGFNLFAEPFNWPVIGWENGVGVVIMASIVAMLFGGTSIRRSS